MDQKTIKLARESYKTKKILDDLKQRVEPLTKSSNDLGDIAQAILTLNDVIKNHESSIASVVNTMERLARRKSSR